MNAPTVASPAEDLAKFDTIQELRYSVAGAKGGDGDPAYARDVSLIKGKIQKVFTDETGDFRYPHEGD